MYASSPMCSFRMILYIFTAGANLLFLFFLNGDVVSH